MNREYSERGTVFVKPLRSMLIGCGLVIAACAPPASTAPAPKFPAAGIIRPSDTSPSLIVPPEPTGRAWLVHLIDSVISQPKFRSAEFGVLVVNPRSADTLFSHNAGKLFIPASNMKIITSAVALRQLGPEYKYRTTFAARGTVRDSVLSGDLIVIGRGDPSVNDTLRGSAMSVMYGFADSLRAHGVKRITGAIVSGGNAFPDSVHGESWGWDDLGEYYAAGTDELFFNDGMAPTFPKAGGGLDSLFSGPSPDPDRNYLNALALGLTRRGFTIGGGVAPKSLDPVPAIDTLFVFQSLPLRDILPAFLKPSQNQFGELLMKTVGLERAGSGTADSALRIFRQQLLAWGAEPDGFVLRDGSGLSAHDLVTPETVVRVLATMEKDPDFKIYYDAMPIAGVDGTIRNRMKGTAAQGNIHAKTGTLQHAISLSGYVTTADGARLIFSILCNNFTTRSSEVTAVGNAIGAALASYDSRSN
ncbi:MAG: D-alanyl-D-alanine carboxypeptidase/D-alanyl-D-alanine-endopeptidase [Gemmatimonadota bacterium]|nr:D-alanyl-D-alanine carboxypeptidase/D-alanyl-D-alanine-endopeptidase [Gemmatimonadota bacterium]